MKIFLDDRDYRVFLFCLNEVVDEYDLECWNYCLMPNHYHLSVCPRRANFSNAIRRLNSEYAKGWNRRHQRVGHVFQGRFKDQIVQNSGYVFALSRYVALNPVRAELVSTPGEWPWASYPALAGLTEPQPFLLAAPTLNMFGRGDIDAQRRSFSEFVLAPSRDDTVYERLRSNERIIGDRAFKESFKPRASPRPRDPEAGLDVATSSAAGAAEL